MPTTFAQWVATWALKLGASTAVTNVVYTVAYYGAQIAIASSVSYGVNRLMAKNPSFGSLSSAGLDNTTTIKSAVAPRQIIYGQVRTGGVLLFAETSGTNNELLNLVIAFAGHEVYEIGDIYFNDELVPLSGSDATGTYYQYASIYKHLGTTTQTVDTDLQSAVGAGTWSDEHRLRGIAYIYVRLRFSTDKFPGGIPDISAIVKGRLVFDPRDSSTAYSTNWALCVRDYLCLSGLGLGVDSTEIDIDECNAAANVSDENIVLADSTTEKRYTINGVIDLSETPSDILNKMTSAGSGLVLYVGGKWIIRAGSYQTPTITFDENDFRGPINVQTKLSRREIFNGVKGLYVSADNQYQPADFPVITNATYTSEDGGERIWRDVEFPFTTSNATAQRIAKIELERCRQQITAKAAMKLTAMTCQVGDVVQLSNTRMGWSSKAFEVIEFTFATENTENGPALGVDLVLRETASGVWDWNDGEETTVDLAPNTSLYNPLTVETLTGLTLSTSTFIQTDGTVVPRIKAVWTLPTSQYILSGGYVHIEYKKSADSTWLIWTTTLNGSSNEDYVTDVTGGVSYDVRARFESVNSVRGAYGVVYNYTVSNDTTAPATPTGLIAAAGAGSIILDWNDNTEDDLNRYNVYRNSSDVFGGATNVFSGLASSFADYGVTVSVTQYYWLTAVDNTGNESTETTSVNAAANPSGGSPGADGLNVANVFAYQRAASAPTNPSASTTYTFATGGLTGLNNGWVTGVPAANGNPLYVIVATASNAASTDTIAAGEWSGSVILAEDGADGTNGSNGLNVASVFIYQRAASTPALPSTSATYTFATGGLTGLNNGWLTYVPTTNGNPLYVSTATASSAASTDTITSGEWATATILAQDGATGPTGPALTYSITINWHPSGTGGGYINGTSYSGTSSTVTGLNPGSYATIEADATVAGDNFSAWSGSAFDTGQLESSVSTNPNRVLMGGNITLTADYI